MKGIHDLTEQDKVYIEKYANEGKGDTWISNELGVRRDVVGKLTTKFWERKMNNKPKR
jgi:hypothetical protein|tara:strand:+ start:32003 stop:32176 length:174 start_codon:yes stop_codon:yes gene_type:complete